jgi:ABC-type iron transport system FetAB ATPase subunit
MAIQKNVDGVYIDLTPEELAQREVMALKTVEKNKVFKAKLAQQATDKASGKQKLKDLGLDDAEIKELTGA